MTDAVESLFKERHAFYEVAAYHILTAAGRVHAGFDVDVSAARTNGTGPFMPPRDEYARAAAALATVAEHASRDAAGTCQVEAFSFQTTVTFGMRGHPGEPAAMFRIRIAASSLDRQAGAPETRALADVEQQLKALGILRQ
jgi:hypothetical protein